ncbi:hypothetical protein Sango_0532000 [Sesamum angolense]|uniref:Organ specific protein n=1 Tax=Sesamum angolense TaxID=2727404 RepID=A0AAE1X4T5_9LAMI|nr:hypothetical protein Sango_0532000 [Sesamum angolense]
MRSSPSLFVLLLSLLLFACVATDARKDPGAYWNSVMNGDQMPKAIGDLLIHDQTDLNTKPDDRFVRDFDTKANVIIYHSHDDHQQDHVRLERSEVSDVNGLK